MLKKFFELAMGKILNIRREKDPLVLDIFPGEAAFFIAANKK